ARGAPGVGLATVVVDVDALGPDGLRHGFLAALDVLLEPHALLGDGALVGNDVLLAEHHFVLILGDVRAIERGVAIAIGDGFPLDADLFAADGHGLGDLVLDDVLLEPDAAGLAFGRADAQLRLRDGHRIVGVRPAGIAIRAAAVVSRRVGVGGHAGTGARPGVQDDGAFGVVAVLTAVVVVQGLFLVARELPVRVDARGVLDRRLLERDADAVVGRL